MQFAPFGETQNEWKNTDLLIRIKLGLIVVFVSDFVFFSLPAFARTLLVSPLVVPKVFFCV